MGVGQGLDSLLHSHPFYFPNTMYNCSRASVQNKTGLCGSAQRFFYSMAEPPNQFSAPSNIGREAWLKHDSGGRKRCFLWDRGRSCANTPPLTGKHFCPMTPLFHSGCKGQMQTETKVVLCCPGHGAFCPPSHSLGGGQGLWKRGQVAQAALRPPPQCCRW